MLPKVLANCWGILLIIMVLGFSIVDVAKKCKKKLYLKSELEYNYVKLAKQKQKLEELEYSLEFKIATTKAEIKNITDTYKKKKFEHLLDSLPFEINETHDMDDSDKNYFKEEITLEDTENEIYYYLMIKYKHKKLLKKSAYLTVIGSYEELTFNHDLKEKKDNFSVFYYKSLRYYLMLPVFVFVIGMSALILLLIVFNGFDLPRGFIANDLSGLNWTKFGIVFNTYLLFLCYLNLHGILKAKFQNFKGLVSGKNTDLQSLIYFAR